MVAHFASELAKRNCNKIKIKRGKVFDYMGMNLNFESSPCTLIISMIEILQEVLNRITAKCPLAKNAFFGHT